ncbi:MAG TPA: L,D-transpeptidase [Ktedonobacterales bacterium]|jgi:lipoprotein-anchoring transpeptidase ErfK/SrfK
MTLAVQHAHGHPRFALTGESVAIRGIVIPYVPHQKVAVRFQRNGRDVLTRTVSVTPVGNGAGQFHIAYTSSATGVLRAFATHGASAGEGAFSAATGAVRIVSSTMHEGDSGPAVKLLQEQLSAMHVAVPVDGSYNEATGRAVVAYRKLTGLARITSTSATMFHLLQRGAGQFHVRYRSDGRHVEADLTRQLLAEIEAGGRVRRIYTMSSGKPSTPTVIGRFQVYSKTPGTNAKGMVDSNYFIRGYAIHGYAEVPTFAASHGCLRVPIPDAPAIFAWVQLGTPVDVYFESGGGSHSVRGNAGP